VLVFVAGSVNRPPAIVKVEVQPEMLKRADTATLKVNAHDPDGDALKFEWKAGTGKVTPDAANPHQARYQPAERSGIADNITVTATDARGLASSSSVAVTIEAPPPSPTPTPEPEVADLPPAPITPPPATPVQTGPMRRTPPTAVPTLPPTASPPPPPNRPPVLAEGNTITELGKNPIVLVASGSEPDNEPVTFNWDFGPCLESKNVSQFEAEVKLIGQCSYAVAILTWTDPHGETASCQWTIHR
jgi:hypothetical protein